MKFQTQRSRFIIISLIVMFAMLSSSFAPLLSHVQSQEAQTNPQSTDIFTGQFIPAYLGSAYDPTEAYKQLAGATVYIFAYDTWGQPVNDFAYRTQIRADGSFQAAGLSNASHYAVYFSDFSELSSPNQSKNFRVPKSADNLQTVFAYQQAAYPSGDSCHSPKVQTKGKRIDGGGDGSEAILCPQKGIDGSYPTRSLFVTSSRTVDIANHVNIFPLVPTTILSLLLNDSSGGLLTNSDGANHNTPYEIYAQRILINNDSPSGSPETLITNTNLQTNGPIIRGRTTYYVSHDASGNATGSSTIFQAYAPRGLYAITYWRPDSRDPNSTITYLTYNGSDALNTPYNGMAFEQAQLDSTAVTGSVSKTLDWGYLSSRPAQDANQAWDTRPGGLNVWGIISSSQGGVARPEPNVSIKATSRRLGLVDLTQRSCDKRVTKIGDSSIAYNFDKTEKFGVYFYTNTCDPQAAPVGTSSTETFSIQAGSLSGTSPLTPYQGQESVPVVIGGIEGPARQDISLLSKTTTGVDGTLQRNKNVGMPYTKLDLVKNGNLLANVATTDKNGYFSIGGGYFADIKSDSSYTILAHDPLPTSGMATVLTGQGETYAFRINAPSLLTSQLAMAHLGTLAVGTQMSTTGRWLASLSLPNFLSSLRLPTAYAAGDNNIQYNTFNPDNMVIYLNQDSLKSFSDSFTPKNYSLKVAEVTAPAEAQSYGGIDKSEYVNFIAYGDTSNQNSSDRSPDGTDQGIITNDMNPATNTPNPNSTIIGVRLAAKQDITHSYSDILGTLYQNTSLTEFNFNLSLVFERKAITDGSITPSTTSGSVSQGGQASPPSTLTASMPIRFLIANPTTDTSAWADRDASNNSTRFQMAYTKIPLLLEAPGCNDGGGGGFSILHPFSSLSNLTDTIKAIPCKAVMGSIHLVQTAIDWMAGEIFTIDPLGKFPMVADMWNITRNFVNGLAVLILVIAGIAIMLRYEPKTYSLQSVLTKLIVTIILVNFSILIIQMAIDIANVLALGGYHLIVSTLQTVSGYEPVSNSALGGAGVALAALAGYIFVLTVSTGGIGALGIILGILGIFCLLAYVIIRAFVDYALRMVVIILCIALAPLAFASRVLPGTAGYFQKWKGIFVGALVAQVAFALVLGATIGLLLNIGRGDGGLFTSMLSMLLTIGLFYYSTKVPAKAAAMFGENLSAGLSGGLKKGLSEVSSRAKVARTKLIEGKQRKIAKKNYQDERADLLGVKNSNFIKRKAVLAGDSFGQFRNNRLQRAGGLARFAGMKAEDIEKAEKEGTERADKAVEARFGRRNPGHFEEHRAEEREKLRQKGIDMAFDTQHHDVGAYALSQISRSAEIARTDKLREASMRNNHPESLVNRDLDAARQKEYSLANESLGQILEGMSFTDAGKSIDGLTSSAYAIDNTYRDSSGTNHDLGDMTAGSAYKTGFDAFTAAANRGAGLDAGHKAVLETFVTGSDFSNSRSELAAIDGFTYGTSTGADAWRQWFTDSGIYTPDDLKTKDVRGAAVKMLKHEVVKKSGVSGWLNQVAESETQATKAGVPDRGMVNTLGANATPGLTTAGWAHATPAAGFLAPRLTVIPPTMHGEDLRDAVASMALVRRAYDWSHANIGSTLSVNSTPQLSEYNAAVTKLTNIGYEFA
jgi:hypothetical protein